jgi:cytochrome c biogenesis factor
MSVERFRKIFIIVMVLVFLPTIFPIFAVANRVEPIILGVPFSFFWVVMWIVIAFAALLVLYFVDPER